MELVFGGFEVFYLDFLFGVVVVCFWSLDLFVISVIENVIEFESCVIVFGIDVVFFGLMIVMFGFFVLEVGVDLVFSFVFFFYGWQQELFLNLKMIGLVMYNYYDVFWKFLVV